jgi:hypothetical protein
MLDAWIILEQDLMKKILEFWGGLEWYEGDEKIVCRGSRFPVSSEET